PALRKCWQSDTQQLLAGQTPETALGEQRLEKRWLALWLAAGIAVFVFGRNLPAVGKATLCGLWLLAGLLGGLNMLWQWQRRRVSLGILSLAWQQAGRHGKRSLAVV
ncbi:MAG: hypothetical protein N3A66_09125, partial [Planctomycetota bacterium]|nr:hypothetical protein [Planctomycetota bacterium]